MTKVIGNNNRREFMYGSEVPGIVMKKEFAHLVPEQKRLGFIHYRGDWLHLTDFIEMCAGRLTEGERWDRYLRLKPHEIVLLKMGKDGYSYTIATMVW